MWNFHLSRFVQSVGKVKKCCMQWGFAYSIKDFRVFQLHDPHSETEVTSSITDSCRKYLQTSFIIFFLFNICHSDLNLIAIKFLSISKFHFIICVLMEWYQSIYL